MSAAFTLGPWTFDGPPDSRIVWAGTELRVCFLTSDGPNLENARLIAAAPDLYKALEKARNTLAGCGMKNIAANICDAALAKVRGEQ